MRTSRRGTLLVLLLAASVVQLPGRAAGAPQIFGSVSERQEIEMGRAAARRVEQQSRLLRDPYVNGYIQALGRQLADASERPDLRYTFKVIDRRDANAFALPGGFIYLHRGIIRLSRNESELAGVLAHEISHVTARHGIKQAEKAQTIGLGLGLLDLLLGRTRNTAESVASLGANLFAQGIFFKYSRDAEREADRLGVGLLRRVGINPNGMVTLFQRMDRMQRGRSSLVGDFFASHPSLREREENISHLLRASDRRLRRDSRAFRSMKRRLG